MPHIPPLHLFFGVSLFGSDILPAVIAMPLSRRLFPSAPQTRKRLAQRVRAGNSARHDMIRAPQALRSTATSNFFNFCFPPSPRVFSPHLRVQLPDLRQIPLHFAPSVPQRVLWARVKRPWNVRMRCSKNITNSLCSTTVGAS
jgi:hypothetical protein